MTSHLDEDFLTFEQGVTYRLQIDRGRGKQGEYEAATYVSRDPETHKDVFLIFDGTVFLRVNRADILVGQRVSQ